MKYSPAILDEIRARLSVSEVVGRRVRLKRQGREFAGLSPFNPEKTPSFFVNDQKGFYHCFSSGKHGDIFKFLMETEGLQFGEAVERLAGDAGVTLPKADYREVARERERASLAEVCEMAAVYFQESLKLSVGQAARAYIDKRGLSRITVAEFRIGYAPAERDGLKRYLAGKGVDEQAMLDTGLIIKPEDAGRPSYDRFRNRLMIPIQDERGRVVAFGGRALSAEDQPKYLNSPETELFHKGTMLFNAHRARADAYDSGSMTVVEGYLDAIAVYQAGIKSVVATLGTAFTEEQIARLWKYAAEPIICFDGDKAGIKAAHRAVDRILPQLKSGYSFNFAFLPDGKDPDELIRAGGKEAFQREIARAVPLAEVLWDRETREASLDTPERKAALEKRLEDLTGEIKDPRVQRIYRLRYRMRLSNLFWESERGPRGSKGSAAQSRQYEALLRDYKQHSPRLAIERILLGLTVEYPEALEKYYEDLLERVIFLPEAHARFLSELYRIVINADGGAVANIYDQIDAGYYMVYDEVYGIGRVKDGRFSYVWGHKLRERVPVLVFKPPGDFIEDYFVHHVDWLLLGQMEAELDQEFSDANEDLTETDLQRLLTLKRELMVRREEYTRRDTELADRARGIRQAYGLDAVVRDWKPFFEIYREAPRRQISAEAPLLLPES